MRAINHALTGAVIGLVSGEPIVALPAAVASHFVCDAIPHHGVQKPDPKVLRATGFLYGLLLDALLCGLLVAALALAQPPHWVLAAFCAFLAASPDFFWFGRYISAIKKRSWRPTAFHKFAAGIQWFQRPIGWTVEVAWFIGATVLLYPYLN